MKSSVGLPGLQAEVKAIKPAFAVEAGHVPYEA